MDVSRFQYKQFHDYSPFFRNFNPVQQIVLEKYLQGTNNLVLSAPTGSGKTEIAEFYICEALARDKRTLLLVPAKALAEEKFEKWSASRHGFSKVYKMLMTGDYQMSDKRKRFLDQSKIIVATSEMLDHRTRHIASEKSQWIHEVGTLIVDEAHLLTDGKDGDGRGHKLEAAIMRFAKCNPQARIVLLSATMPNVDQLSQWLTGITGRPTDLHTDTYRPTKLTRHMEPYYDRGNFHVRYHLQMQKVLEIINRHPEDQFLVFTSTKKWGREFLGELSKKRIPSDFHNADKRRDELSLIEQRFKAKQIRVLVATQTLAAGVNLPARRVIVAHVTYGKKEDVPVYEIHQKEGRAGRLGLDTEGDSYILVPQTDKQYHEERIQKGEQIISQLNFETSLLFHLLGEISYGNVTSLATAEAWYQTSFAYYQTSHIPDLDKVFATLKNYDMICENKSGDIQLTRLGEICAMFYLHPVDVYYWYQNFKEFFDKYPRPLTNTKQEDVLLSWALANVPSYQNFYANTDIFLPEGERDNEFLTHQEYCRILRTFDLSTFEFDRTKDVGYLIYLHMNGLPTSDYNYSIIKGLENDHERLLQAIQTIDGYVAKWGMEVFFKTIILRLNYKVPARYIPLVQMKGVAKKLAHSLWEAGLKTPEDIIAAPEKMKGIPRFGEKRIANILDSARELVYNKPMAQTGLFEGVHGTV